TPCPATSPTTSATRTPGRLIAPYQPPPTSTSLLPGRYRCLTSTEEGADSPVGSIDRCSVSAVACSRLYRRALSKKTAAREANSMPISMSYASNLRVSGCRTQQKNPSMVPLATIRSSSIHPSDIQLATRLGPPPPPRLPPAPTAVPLSHTR